MRESLQRLRQLFDAPSDERPDGSLEHFNVAFSDVCFRYDSSGCDVLRNLTFSIPEGKITAIVGPSGSGKSTILRLLSRLWEPGSGAICVGETDIGRLSVKSYSRYISMVEQDVVLFRDTVLNNIRVGRPDATREEVLAAAEAARCGQFVCRLENGYDTVLAENGRSLSGGERQRLSIARAILKDAPLLLLDEATASLDPENEGLVQQALSALLKQGKTVVVVAHRLSTIEDADQIIVIENGQVKEKGRHDALMRIDGTYRKLYDLQQSAAGWSVSS
jgi:ATP-binding cassette subfamily B protein